MRKINTKQFRRATHATSREINRTILLNLVREHQPISRADLARWMELGRGAVTLMVNQLIDEGVIREGATVDAPRGRRPRMLHLRTGDRYMIAVDVGFALTAVRLSDLEGRQVALETCATAESPGELVSELALRIRCLLRAHGVGDCEGIGVVVPGTIDRWTGRVLNSPQLGWRDVDLRHALAAATGLPVYLETAPVACALARMWLDPSEREGLDDFVYVTVSDDVGTGVVVNGEVLRGHKGTAGEFGHLPLTLDGPRCLCGLRGCWEAYTSNLATLARYFGLDASLPESRKTMREKGVTILDLIARAREGDVAARATLQESGRYLGLGLAGIINAINPARIIVGGEITAAWDLIGQTVCAEARERTLTEPAAATPIIPVRAGDSPQLRGATALLVARSFAAPRVA